MENIFSKLIAFPTITGDSQAAHELIEYVADFVRARGMHVERYISGGFESLVATTKPHDKQPTVMLAAHGDVVKASEEQFILRKRDGKYYGRGVLDMKCALAAYLQIIDDLKDNVQDYSLGLMVTMDEETGGEHGVLKLANEGYRPKVVVLPDGGDNWQIQTASKGILVYKVTARGTSAHSSRHWEGDNALTKLRAVLPEFEALFPGQDRDTNTISINKIEAGVSLTQVPNRASATMDIRTLNETEHLRIMAAVQRICKDNQLDYQLETEGDPTYFDLNDPYIKPYVRLIEKVVGIKVTGTKTLATSDARFLAPFGIPCISFYPAGGSHHSAKEWVSVEAVDQLYHITKDYVVTMADAELERKAIRTKKPNLSGEEDRNLQPA